MELQTNPQLELAFEYVRFTNKNIFLTGKAGTGKTTFLQRIKKEVVKRIAVVAPTGVAAINAGGMTIHSFFQLPFGPFLPGNSRDAARQRKFSGEKIRVIKGLDLLVIDEISMVRADLLDGIDEVLRRYKNAFQPFGGVQLLMIGDLHQLPPVVKDEEWNMLREHYQTPYFFSSLALQQTKPVTIQLKHIFRQSDTMFIDLLNKVRNNRVDAEVLALLNSRFIPDFQPGKDEGYITLTTHNASAQEINTQRLTAIKGDLKTFQAKINKDFPSQAYPTDEVLEVKTGAQVMFVKNDLAPEKRFYNGKIGTITRIKGDNIYVLCPEETEEIEVKQVDWENIKYTLNEKTKEVTEEILGTFTQYPLKLAWAITIHKSQGLTFEKVILDAQAAFAHGQVYVALSRCKSFEGIVLRSRIIFSSVRTDPKVRNFSEQAEKNAPDATQLEQSKRDFQQFLLMELFGFSNLTKLVERLRRILLEHEKTLGKQAFEQFLKLQKDAEIEVIPIATKFRRQLQNHIKQKELPEENSALQDRIQKASAWFGKRLKDQLIPTVERIEFITENKAILKTASQALTNLQQELFIKNVCFWECQTGFSTDKYQRTKSNAVLDFQTKQKAIKSRVGVSKIPTNTPHPELFVRLKKWRTDFAKAHNISAYQVLFTKTLLEIVQALPADLVALDKIKGIGKSKSKRFGSEVVAIVRAYCQENDIPIAQLSLIEEGQPEKKAPKVDSKTQSLELFKAGKTIEEIAMERGFVRGTIEGHLGHFIAKGELSVFELIEEPDVRKIETFFLENQTKSTSEAKAHFGEDYSYNQLRMVLRYLESVGRES